MYKSMLASFLVGACVGYFAHRAAIYSEDSFVQIRNALVESYYLGCLNGRAGVEACRGLTGNYEKALPLSFNRLLLKLTAKGESCGRI